APPPRPDRGRLPLLPGPGARVRPRSTRRGDGRPGPRRAGRGTAPQPVDRGVRRGRPRRRPPRPRPRRPPRVHRPRRRAHRRDHRTRADHRRDRGRPGRGRREGPALTHRHPERRSSPVSTTTTDTALPTRTRAAMLYGAHDLRTTELDVPALGDTDVLVR